MTRKLVSFGSPYEPRIGFSRAVRVGNMVAVSGTAPIAPDGGVACPGDLHGQTSTFVEVKGLIDKAWLVEIEADCVADG